MSNENIENNQEENQNKCEDKKSCWVKTQPTNFSNYFDPKDDSCFYTTFTKNDRELKTEFKKAA